MMLKLWQCTNEITKAEWPKAYQAKSPCPTLKVSLGLGGQIWFGKVVGDDPEERRWRSSKKQLDFNEEDIRRCRNIP